MNKINFYSIYNTYSETIMSSVRNILKNFNLISQFKLNEYRRNYNAALSSVQ